MKKFKKLKNKTPLKSKLNNTGEIISQNQIKEQKHPEDEFIYKLNPKIINNINSEKKDEAKETLERKNKSIDLKTEYNQNQKDISDLSQKKTKKRLIKKKKKSKKKDMINIGKINNKNIENPSIDYETPTPNGNDEDIENFYLIDYQSKNKDTNNQDKNISKETEDNYNTFHENELKEISNPSEINNLNSNNIEKFRKFNFTISSNNSSNGFNNNDNKVNINDKINPEKLNFEEIENNRHNKMKKIKFREKNENKKINDEETENNDNKIKDNSNEIEKETENDFHVMYRDIKKKKRKILTKKKKNIQNSKIILIQSFWRKYQIRKLISVYKYLKILNSILNKIINIRLKNYLSILFQQFNLKDNKNQNIKSIKKIKKRKLKIKNIIPRNLNDNFEDKIFQNKTFNYNNDNVENTDGKKNGNKSRNILLEDRKLFINDNENMGAANSNPNYIKTFETKNIIINNSFLNNPINIENKYDNNKIEEIISQNKKELSLKNIKIKSKLKQFKISTTKQLTNKNLSYSFDSKIFSPERKYLKPEVKIPNFTKIYIKPIENSKKMSIHLKNRNKFPKESLIKCNNEIVYISNNHKIQNVSYYKKVIGEKTFNKNKTKRNNIDYSLVKFIISIKDIISNSIRTKYYYEVIKYLNRKSILKRLINIYHNKNINLMKNSFNEYRFKLQVLKYIENYNKIKGNNLQISKIKNIIIKDNKSNKNKSMDYEVERNELSIIDNVHNEKLKNKYKYTNQFNNSILEITKNIFNIQTKQKINNNKFKIDNSIKGFNIKSNCKREIKFSEKQLLIYKNIANMSIYRKIKPQNIIDKTFNNRFIIKRKYNKEILFKDCKLIVNKNICHIELKKQINKKMFIIQKVNKINILQKKNIYKKLIITKIINKSPILSLKYNINNNLLINKIYELNLKGIIKKNNSICLNKVNNFYIIDDIYKYKQKNNIIYHQNLIRNNKDNLIIVKIISNLNIKNNNNNKINYIICRQIKNSLLGNNLNSFEFNEKKLVITKAITYLFKNKGVYKIKIGIIYSTCLLKVKSVILKNIHRYIYPILINIMKKYSFCIHLNKFNKIETGLLKIIFINNLKNKKLEEKYKNYTKNKFNILIINKVIKFNILINNRSNIFDNKKTIKENIINYNILDSNDITKNNFQKNNFVQLPRHYIIHKVKLFSMNNENSNNIDKNYGKNKNYEEEFLKKLYEKKYKNFIKDNIISRNINLFIGNKNQKINIKDMSFLAKENYTNSHNNNKINLSSLKINNSKNNNNKIKQNFPSYNSPYIYNNKIYYKIKQKENENITKEMFIDEIQKNEKTFEKMEMEKSLKLNEDKEEEYEEEEEEEIEEIEEEEEESGEIEETRDILLNCINKKNEVLNGKLSNAFQKWKKVKENNKTIKIKENNDDICENGGINRSKKIFLIYRKYSNYLFLMKKKMLRSWKKIVEAEKNNQNKEEKELEEIEEKSEFEDEEEEFDEYEEENEEEESEKMDK